MVGRFRNRPLLFNLLLITLFVCGLIPGESRASEKKLILKVFTLPDPRSSDAFTQADLAVIRAFEKQYPHIELRQFSGITIEGQSMDSGPLMAIAGGVSPDIIYVNFRQSDTYIKRRFLYPLDEYLDQVSEQDQNLRIEKPVWPVIKRKGIDDKEHIWAIPTATLIRVLVYRKDMFVKAGLDPERPPATWDELLEYARRMTIPEEGTYGINLASGPFAAWDWITYLWSAGGNAVRQDPETDKWEACFDDDAAVDAMEFYLKLITTKWRDAEGKQQEGFAFRGPRSWRLWSAGKIGMQLVYLDSQDLGRGVDPQLYGVAAVPRGWSGVRGSELNCKMMGIFSGAGESNNSGLGDRDPMAVKQAAWNYIWFTDSEEARKIRMKVLVEAGFGKILSPILLKRYGYDEYAKFTSKSLLLAYTEALENGKPEPYGKNCQRVYEFMTYPLDKCIGLAREEKLGVTREARRAKIKELLQAAVSRTNEEMLGLLTPKERMVRNRVAQFVAFFISIAFCMVLYKVWQIFTPKHDSQAQGWMIGKYFYAYLLLIPGLGSILLWKYIPMIMGSIMAFQDYHLVGENEWIGFQNFADVLFDKVWWECLGRTLIYMLLSLGLGFLPPIFLAILLQEVSHGKVVYRTIYYLPAVITGVIVIYLWKLLYDPSEAGGLNQILMSLGLEKQRWLKDPKLAMLCCIIPSVWAGMGPGCLIYLAALKGIPDDIYEAADLDGASFTQKIRYIVFPTLKALIIIQFIAAFIAASQQSGFILVMTFGGPQEATRVAGLLIFERAYMYLKFGMATTMAWMLWMMLMGLTVFQLKRLSNMEFKAAGTQT